MIIQKIWPVHSKFHIEFFPPLFFVQTASKRLLWKKCWKLSVKKIIFLVSSQIPWTFCCHLIFSGKLYCNIIKESGQNCSLLVKDLKIKKKKWIPAYIKNKIKSSIEMFENLFIGNLAKFPFNRRWFSFHTSSHESIQNFLFHECMLMRHFCLRIFFKQRGKKKKIKKSYFILT